MVEIDLTLSDDENQSTAQPPQLVTPLRCKSQSPQPLSPPSSDAAAAINNSGGGADNGDKGLTPATTGGKGLWSLWTRNFKSPLLMLMDLVDNAVDAALQRDQDGFVGRVNIYRDLYEVVPEQTYTTGICIRNNAKEIAPLKEILKLFISAKENSGTASIGENGVGLKQSCAALSDLSFVLVKNGTKKFELGVIAKAMQKLEAMYLPCFEFHGGDGGETIAQQMLNIFNTPEYEEVAACVAEYGRVRSGGDPSLARGVARLSKHFDDMNQKFFDNPYVFEVIIDNMLHRGRNHDPNDAQDKNVAVRGIINELQREIPRRYLHLNDNFKFCIGKKELSFKYWPERLVEFTKIEIPVRSQVPWSEGFGEMTPDSYYLRIFLGFDRYRITDPDSGIANNKSCSLYIYSRASGRMIQYVSDARILLGLTAGGTMFCQALTVIIDDIDGHLPLDPTKQGIAFGNQVSGNVHEENLYAVVNCVVKFFYNYHLNNFGGRKAVLSAKIKAYSDAELPDNLKTCGNCNLSDYGVRFSMTKKNRIQVDHSFTIGVTHGPDTIFRLTGSGNSSKKAAQKDKRSTTVRKKPSRKKQPKKRAAKTPPTKKQRTSHTTPPPPQRKGLRSKSRQSKKQAESESESESDLESKSDSDLCEDDKEDTNCTTNRVGHNVKMEASGVGNDTHPIDLCSSSDEEDGEYDAMTEGSFEKNPQASSPKITSSAEDLQSENSNLRARVAALETKNGSLEKQVRKLRQKLEQSDRIVSVIKRRTNKDHSIDEEGDDV
eukprot:CAMPEP_0183746238 /NCGR_PEP_ID=MMETSP0737-20130205/66652_1 /TAXON_ID=385413 /ORGANISM="Thalassiosira miniscula, Strain CCMP1093" /LENGTH=772 /DNA_ID=CAMNT_0025981925 /DNA_START=112 /DNA_END=2430 /DNA_ORIENTATION=+